MHGIGVHDPRHGLLVGIYIGGGYVFFRPDEFDDLRGVATRHALEFAHRHFVGIANHAALGSAERNVDDRALPSHPAGQRAYFVERDIGSVANTALAGASCNRVLHAKASEDLEVAVVHADREVHDHFAIGSTENLPQALVQIELLGCGIKPGRHGLVGVRFLLQAGCYHKNRSPESKKRIEKPAHRAKNPPGGRSTAVYGGWRGTGKLPK